jgi:hypothetical protein
MDTNLIVLTGTWAAASARAIGRHRPRSAKTLHWSAGSTREPATQRRGFQHEARPDNGKGVRMAPDAPSDPTANDRSLPATPRGPEWPP